MKFFRQVFLLTLALLVLVSSTGLSVGMHLCAGEIRDFSFFGEAQDCPMEQKKETLPPCHAPAEDASQPQDCCEDQQLLVERLDVAPHAKEFSFAKPLDLSFAALAYTFFYQLFPPQDNLKAAFTLYSSPPLARDLPVLLQTFLI